MLFKLTCLAPCHGSPSKLAQLHFSAWRPLVLGQMFQLLLFPPVPYYSPTGWLLLPAGSAVAPTPRQGSPRVCCGYAWPQRPEAGPGGS